MSFFAPLALFFGYLGIYLAMHFVFIYQIEEIGYTGKHKARRLKKMKKQLGFWDKFFIISISQNVVQHELVTFLIFIANFITVVIFPVFSLVMCVVSLFVGIESSVFLLGIKIPIVWLGGYVILSFIPDLLFNPSERKRYGLSNSKRRK